MQDIRGLSVCSDFGSAPRIVFTDWHRMVAPSAQKVYVITGASRGLGLGLVAGLMKQDSTAVVVAAARNPDKSEALQKLVEHYAQRIHTVALDTGDEASVKVWLQSLGKLAFWCSQTCILGLRRYMSLSDRGCAPEWFQTFSVCRRLRLPAWTRCALMAAMCSLTWLVRTQW